MTLSRGRTLDSSVVKQWCTKPEPLCLGLLRSDLMLETTCLKKGVAVVCEPYCCWKQVEINTIASGFGWLGPSSSAIQRSA
uniref:Uncharacterized protein n=1 Tax=Timema monikensis TaxID=170555 RepID=A0A7R9HSY3_9NEOP|nr:unnamed protein product [Timema monikensis]